MPYGRYIFPFMMDLGMRGEPFSSLRRELLREIRGEVLEIGAGTGLNFKHYPAQVTRLTTVDPNPGMSTRAGSRARKAPFPVEHIPISAESLPLEDNRFDAVVTTWTLCSIPDADAALAEVFRVLRPGGLFYYIEHGLAPDEHVQKWQHRLTPVQKVIADGCHLNRPIGSLIHGAGFEMRSQKEFYLKHAPKSVGYFYMGQAAKPDSTANT